MRAGVVSFLIVFYLCSCNSKCEDIICLNGGVCNDGVCDCPPGFTGPLCGSSEIPDCDNVVCLNGGVCLFGQCECPAGFNGVDCSELDLNLYLTIQTITISSYPVTDGGTPWDDPFFGSSSSADVQWRINGPGNNDAQGGYFSNASGNSIFYDGIGLPVTIAPNNLNDTYVFQVWDVDDLDGSDFGSADDLMASISFVPENYISSPSNPFPPILQLNHFGGTQIVLSVSYNWVN